MVTTYVYACTKCTATKTITDDTKRTGHPPQDAPDSMICGWRGCKGGMVRADEGTDKDERERIIQEWAGYMSTIGRYKGVHPQVALATVRECVSFLDSLSVEEKKRLLLMNEES